jgi:hypothetical protein
VCGRAAYDDHQHHQHDEHDEHDDGSVDHDQHDLPSDDDPPCRPPVHPIGDASHGWVLSGLPRAAATPR